MTNNAVEECRFQLLQLMLRDGQELMQTQPWALEQDRWVELVFAVLAELSELPQAVLRQIAEELSAFGLLSIPTLAQPLLGEGLRHHQRMVQVMQEAGLPAETADRAARGLHDIALGLQTHFAGHLQRYLRHYGELMLGELNEYFTFEAMTVSQASNAFTYWLQHALLMPLSNIDAPVKAFCEDLAATPKDMIEAADQLGVNLSLLDDLALLRRQASDNRALEARLKSAPASAREVSS